MALSDTDLHWIPMNRSKFNQIRRMFDVKSSEEQGSRTLPRMPCDKCTSPRIRYTSAESVSALAQVSEIERERAERLREHRNIMTSRLPYECNTLCRMTIYYVVVVHFGVSACVWSPLFSKWGQLAASPALMISCCCTNHLFV